MTDWRTRTKVFYGWWLVGALFVILFFMGGAGFFALPVFIGSYQAEFGWTMEQISWTAGIFSIMFGLSGPVIGTLIAKIGARKTMLIGAFVISLVNLGWAGLQNLPMMYTIAFVAGPALCAATLIPSQTLITAWFQKYVGRAMGLALLGIGFGGMVLPMFFEFLIRAVGWRMSWVIGSVLIWVVVLPIIAIFVRSKPQDIGLPPDGEVLNDSGEEQKQLVGMSAADAVRTLAFPLLVGVYIAQLLGQSIMNFHFIPFAVQEGGFSAQQAAMFFGLATGFSVLGKIIFGWLADRWSPALLMAATGGLAALGPLALEVFVIRGGSSSPLALLLYAIPYGIGWGGQVPLLPVLVGRCFGPRNFGKIQGLVMIGFAVGPMLGPPFAGRIFDKTGSYEIAIIVAIAVFLLSGIFSMLIRADGYRSRFVTG